MPEPAPEDRLASFVGAIAERSIQAVVLPVLNAFVTPIKRIVADSPDVALMIVVGYDALERLKATEIYHLPHSVIVHRSRARPLGYLHRRLPPRAAVEFWLSVEERGEIGILNALERAVRSTFLDEVRLGIHDASVLSEVGRVQLLAAVGHVAAGEWPLAYPLLFAPLEGAFREVATSRPLAIDRGRRRTSRDWMGIERLMGLLGLSSDFLGFLVREVFGGKGNPYRHGTPPDGGRRQTLLLVVALAGCLDRFTGTDLTPALLSRFQRQLERQQIAGLSRRLSAGPRP